MDSGNSGSMQSSSGGDEEFDSRAESISAFLSSSSTNPHHHHHHHQQQQHQPQPQPPNPTILFDPLSNYLSHHDPFSTSRPSPPQNPNNSSLLHNLDMAWSNTRTNTLRSEPNYTHFNTSLMATASSSSPTPPPPPPPTHLQGSTGFSPLQTHQTVPSHHHNTSSSSLPPDRVTSARNSKKRSRASRRAPTTVLTTDTSNFRAMVQEFTGIPAPPFSASPFPRTRFDLFNNSSSSTTRSGLVEPSPPSYLLRPFAQKLHPPSFLSSFSSSSSTSTNTVTPTPSSNTTTTTTTTTTNSTSPNNYQLLSELGLSNKQSTHHQNLLNMHNPSLTFQSLLQSSPPTTTTTTATTTTSSKYPLTIQTTTHNSQLKMGGVLEDFGMNTNTTSTNDHHHVRNQMSGIPNILSTTLEPMSSMRSDNHHNTLSWRDGVGSNDEDQDHLRPFNGNNFDNSRRAAVNGCKSTTAMNYSGSSPDFNGEKGSSAENNNNNVSSRGEGMVDSWICSSD